MSAPKPPELTGAAAHAAAPAAMPGEPGLDLQDNLQGDDEAAPSDNLALGSNSTAVQPAPGRQPWEQLPGEPDLWYGRFQVFLALGPARTLLHSCRQVGMAVRNKPYTLNSIWGNAARRWHWRERALAWDAHQRELLALSERNARISLRERRVAMIDDYLEAVYAVLDNANLAEADQELARAWLPQMRVFLRDLLVAQRQEYEREAYAKEDADNAITITADDLRAAQRALDQAAAAGGQAAEAGGRRAMSAGQEAERTLFVCAGSESAFMLDLAALRAVRSATGLQFKRLLDATRVKFDRYLRRERGLGRPIKLLHLALHAGPAGVEFSDGVADGNWLSERLAGVRIMLIAGCDSDGVGDWLGVIPHVITLGEEIEDADAAVLTQHFWRNIGGGLEPGAALDEALSHCPPVVSEYVVRHW